MRKWFKIRYSRGSGHITLWVEGYAITGGHSDASCLGTYDAVDLNDAVKQYMEQHPNIVDWDRFGKGRHAIWACEIFDNETDARRVYG
ncbi:hypothetical protein LCGC14_2223060 [marine sediment metagenome]|uniref:Uncharacterized protein n=1 Tax=marine sediment metagenome TaxID=412755 RepID=A0A0F9G5W2_9ZZZZ